MICGAGYRYQTSWTGEGRSRPEEEDWLSGLWLLENSPPVILSMASTQGNNNNNSCTTTSTEHMQQRSSACSSGLESDDDTSRDHLPPVHGYDLYVLCSENPKSFMLTYPQMQVNLLFVGWRLSLLQGSSETKREPALYYCNKTTNLNPLSIARKLRDYARSSSSSNVIGLQISTLSISIVRKLRDHVRNSSSGIVTRLQISTLSGPRKLGDYARSSSSRIVRRLLISTLPPLQGSLETMWEAALVIL